MKRQARSRLFSYVKMCELTGKADVFYEYVAILFFHSNTTASHKSATPAAMTADSLNQNSVSPDWEVKIITAIPSRKIIPLPIQEPMLVRFRRFNRFMAGEMFLLICSCTVLSTCSVTSDFGRREVIEDMSISCRTHCICPPEAKHKCTERRDIPGSTAFVPAVAGLMIAGEVIRDLTAGCPREA